MTELFGSIEQVLGGEARCCLQNGDCLDFLRTLPDCSVDSIVDDPPAGISFMGTEFDSDKGGRDNWIAWLTEIARESLRVLKPGGYHITWALPRTSHWTATAIENAGFEIRDIVTHVFGSGFPKSLNLSLAIDKQDGLLGERQAVHLYSASGNAGTSCAEKGGTYSVGVENSPPVQLAVTRGATEKSRKFDGFGTALKPASEHWIIARKPLDGTLVNNALTYGTGGLNIDACRVSTDWDEPDRPDSWKQSGHTADDEADKIAAPPGNGIQCHPAGRWPANFVMTHSVECVADGVTGDTIAKSVSFNKGPSVACYGDGLNSKTTTTTTTTTVYRCVDGCPVKLLNEQSGDLSDATARVLNRTQDAIGECVGSFGFNGPVKQPLQHQDSGGASRFFNTFEWQPELDDPFIYLAKPSTAEREAGCRSLPKRSAGEITGGRDDNGAAQNCPRTGAGRGSGGRHNHHPTLKSIALMTHFIKLVTPPGGVTVSRFLGSGTDVCAALLSGFRCIGFEKESDYFQIAKARVEYWARRGRPTVSKPKTAPVNARQIDLFSTLGGLE